MSTFLTMKINYTNIAEMADVSKQALSNILNGRRRPSWGTAKRLAFVTKTNPVLWLEGTPVEIKKAIDLFKNISQKPYLQ
jgi:transcriptional regulator with XRE-family HTH domain